MGHRIIILAALAIFGAVSCVAVYGFRLGTMSQGSNSLEHLVDSPQEKKSNDSGFAILELFTSEGCSSCPPADRNLTRIARAAQKNKKAIYTLSYHVDYWNYLGWKDPYSHARFSNRQRQYAKQFQSETIYTPQLVVNGRAEFNGGDQKLSDQAIVLAMKLKSKASVAANATINKNSIQVNYKVTGQQRNDVVHVALVQNEGRQKVTRGENARRELSHVNIVRDLKSVSNSKASGSVSFTAPRGFKANEFHVVAFIQSVDDRIIRAASKTSISARKSSRGRASTGKHQR